MKDSEKFEIFRDTLKKAKEGELFNYDKWLRERDVDSNKIKLKHFENYFWRNPSKMIGNDKIVEKIAGYIGLFLKEKTGLYHIAVIGVKGSGKTLLLRILRKFTNDVEPNLGNRVDIIDREEYFSQEIIIHPAARRKKGNNVQFIDNCEKVKYSKRVLENIKNFHEDGVYITSWTPEKWIKLKADINEILPIEEEIVIYPIENNYDKFLDIAIKSIMLNASLNDYIEHGDPYVFPKFIDEISFVNNPPDHIPYIKLFFKFTWGNPLITIKLLLACIKKTFVSREELITEKIISESARELGLQNLHDRLIIRLSDQHLLILLKMLQEISIEGIRPSFLVEKFSLDKSTISYHLKRLKELDILKDEQIGKSKFYYFNEILIPFIQTRILKKYYLKSEV